MSAPDRFVAKLLLRRLANVDSGSAETRGNCFIRSVGCAGRSADPCDCFRSRSVLGPWRTRVALVGESAEAGDDGARAPIDRSSADDPDAYRGYVFAIRSEPALCRDVQGNIAYRWFMGSRSRTRFWIIRCSRVRAMSGSETVTSSGVWPSVWPRTPLRLVWSAVKRNVHTLLGGHNSHDDGKVGQRRRDASLSRQHARLS
jgi:hypothetical protein